MTGTGVSTAANATPMTASTSSSHASPPIAVAGARRPSNIWARAWAWMNTPGISFKPPPVKAEIGVRWRSLLGRSEPISTILPASHGFGSNLTVCAGKTRKGGVRASGPKR
ncbi:MAG: hypothetical protein QF583_09215 [Rhodospirillales bacterium]|nr:hypothetical protein [Rhodospirillales bacterium]HJP53981.1 hypothetical protein [Rhodospirillales bacterium]